MCLVNRFKDRNSFMSIAVISRNEDELKGPSFASHAWMLMLANELLVRDSDKA